MKTKTFYTTALLVLVCIVVTFSACVPGEEDTLSGSRLLLLGITGNDLQGRPGSTVIFSDVLTGGSVINDNAVAEIEARLLDPEPFSGSYYEAVEVERIDVSYTRSDIANPVEGVDIPYAFTQYVNVTINIGVMIELPFVIVRHVAKLESPLIDLQELGQEKILQLTATVTIHGKDKAGNRVEPVVGTVTVWCANFAD